MSSDLLALMRDAMDSRRFSNGTVSETLSDPWRQNPFVRAGVSALYRIAKGIPAKAVTGKRASDEEATDLASDHPLAVLLANPFRAVYGSEIWAQCLALKKLDGHAFVVLYAGADLWQRPIRGAAWPTQMQAVSARRVYAEEADIDQTTGAVRLWRVRQRDGSERQIPSDAMLHLRDFDPDDPVRCSSPLLTAWAGMEADLNVDAYSSAWLKNLGAIGTWIQTKIDIPDDAKKKILAAFNETFGGAGNAGKTFLSGPDLDVKPGPTPQSARDMEMPRLREWNRDVVKAVLAVTDFEMGRVADYNRANSESARRWLIENTILPELEAFEASFWGHVAEPVSRSLRVDEWMMFDRGAIPALRADYVASAPAVATLVGAGFTADSVKAAFGLEQLEFEELPEPEPEPDPPPVAPPAPPPAPPAPPEPAKSGPHIWVKRDQAKPKPLPRRIALRLQRDWARHAERKLGVAWRRFTAKRYDETVRLVRNLSDLGAFAVDSALGSVEAWRVGAEAAATKGLDSGRTLVDNFGDELALRIDVDDNSLKAAAARRVGQMVNVGTKLRTTIRDSIARSLQGGETLEELEKVVAAKFGGRLPSNAATVARTETQIFAADVRYGLMRQQGIDEHEWSAAMDQWTRETHREVDGERVAVGTRFKNGLLHPLESGAPASEVVNCRCVALPYLREIED